MAEGYDQNKAIERPKTQLLIINNSIADSFFYRYNKFQSSSFHKLLYNSDMTIQKIITSILVLPFIIACGNNQKKEAQSSAADTLTYTMDSVGIRKGYASGDTAEASIVYPVIQGTSPLADTLRHYAEQHFRNAATAKAGLDSFIQEYESFAKEMEGVGPAHGWAYQSKTNLLPVYKNLYTLSSFVYEYSGGAHGNYGTMLYTFTKEGIKLNWKDILLPNGETTIQPLLQKAIAKHLSLPETTPIKELGLFIEGNTIPLPQSFALTDKGLRLIYTPYEIAPYAVGEIDITIPYADLVNVLKDQYQ